MALYSVYNFFKQKYKSSAKSYEYVYIYECV